MTIIQSPTVAQLRGTLAAIRRMAADQAQAMPASYYTSPEFQELEKEQIFRREWVCLGHLGEVANPGNFFTTELVGEPLLVVRDMDSEVRVLSNVCRHRGNLVELEGKGTRRAFTCSYHAWTYGADGRLLSAPLMDKVAGFDKANCALPSFRTEIWENFIFVNLERNAAPLAPRMAPLMPHIRNYRQDQRHLLFTDEDVWETNWKCLTENFMEGYHLTPTHSKTLHPITPTSLCEKIPGDENFTAYKSHFVPSWPERGPFPAELTAAEKRYSVLFCVFPSMVVAYAPNMTLYMCLRPRAPAPWPSVGASPGRWTIRNRRSSPAMSISAEASMRRTERGSRRCRRDCSRATMFPAVSRRRMWKARSGTSTSSWRAASRRRGERPDADFRASWTRPAPRQRATSRISPNGDHADETCRSKGARVSAPRCFSPCRPSRGAARSSRC